MKNEFFNVTNEEKRAIDIISKEERTWKQQMIYNINHSEIIDLGYFKSDSGELFESGDIKINCLVKETSERFRYTSIKKDEIDVLYKLIEAPRLNEHGWTVVQKINQ